MSYPDPPSGEEAFDQYCQAHERGRGYKHLHPCVQIAVYDVLSQNSGPGVYPRAFWLNYDKFYLQIWQTNLPGREAIIRKFPVLPMTWETNGHVEGT